MMPESKQKLTRYSLMLEAAERGDIDEIFKIAEKGPFPMSDERDAMKALRVGLQKLAANPPELIEAMFARMLVLQSWLMIRCERHIERGIAESDRKYNDQEIPPEICDTWMPRLSRLQAEVRETSKAMASVRHTLSLSEHGPLKHQAAKNVIRMSDQPSNREAAL